MNLISKMGWAAMQGSRASRKTNHNKKQVLGFLPLVVCLYALTTAFAPGVCPVQVPATCDPPSGVALTGQTSSTATFSFTPSAGTTLMYYVRQDDNFQSQVFSTGGSSFTFTGLAGGTYKCYFASECDGGTSAYIVVGDIIL